MSSTAIPAPYVKGLHEKLKQNDRVALSRAITLVESTRNDHKALAQQLLELVLLDSQRKRSTLNMRRVVQGEKFPTTLRIGLSGAPGVGKSSFIETFGLFLIGLGHKVAVLGLKKGIVELSDMILVNKSDGMLEPAAKMAQ
ncbi:hypothetical protein HK405_009797, partial [Cladochytrium tenue]